MFLETTEEDCRVGAAKTEGIRHGHVDSFLYGLVGYVIQVAGWIAGIEIDGWRNDAMVDCKKGEYGLDRPSAAEKMTDGALCRGDKRRPLWAISEEL